MPRRGLSAMNMISRAKSSGVKIRVLINRVDFKERFDAASRIVRYEYDIPRKIQWSEKGHVAIRRKGLNQGEASDFALVISEIRGGSAVKYMKYEYVIQCSDPYGPKHQICR